MRPPSEELDTFLQVAAAPFDQVAAVREPDPVRLTHFRLMKPSSSFRLAVTALAQYSGPSDRKASATARYASVAEVLKNPVDDVMVTFEGRLVREVGKEKYLFSDGTGEIRVEIDNDVFPKGAVDDKTRVRIHGEVEKDFMQSPEIDVKRIETLGAAAS